MISFFVASVMSKTVRYSSISNPWGVILAGTAFIRTVKAKLGHWYSTSENCLKDYAAGRHLLNYFAIFHLVDIFAWAFFNVK